SPFIVEIEITGTGDGGVAEGSDTFIATVTRVPTIEIFAGENKVTEEGEEVEFVGSFTRPKGLRDIQYMWEFGDQSVPLIVTPEEGVTRAIATHVYADHRPFPYTVTLTVTAQSDAGEIETVSRLNVFVTESKGLVISGWSAGDTGKTAIRALSGVVQVVGSLIIWLAIFSPVWLIGGAALVFGGRRLRARRQARATARRVEEQSVASGSDEQ
ncbi:MAG: PKD domain-containing protein, partial [Chloroflexi bacterium]|nr:PKD domain-containing protein [Chloroflexota bacterium]